MGWLDESGFAGDLVLSDEAADARQALEDFPTFCRTFFQIRDKDGRISPFELKPAQLRLWKLIEQQEALNLPVRIVVLKARQLGFSTMVQAYLLWKALTRPGSGGLVVAHLEEPAATLFGKIEMMYRMLPPEILGDVDPLRITKQRGKQLAWKEPLASSLYVDTAKNPHVGRSQTFQYAHLSELGFWDKPDEAMLSLSNSIPEKPGTTIIVESTANGMGNYFHKLWKNANDPKSGSPWVPLFVAWFEDADYQRPRRKSDKPLTPKERELQREHDLTFEQLMWRRDKIAAQENDEDRFNQENPDSPEVAFLVSGRPYFGRQALRHYQSQVRAPLWTGRWDGSKFAYDAGVDEGSPYWIWEKPKKDGVYVVSADVSEGTAADASAVHVLDAQSLKVVATGWVQCDPDELAWDLWRWARVYNDAMVAPEKNGVGVTVLTTLMKQCGWQNIYSHMWEDRLNISAPTEYGWVTSVKTRPLMLSQLSGVVRTHHLDIPCSRTVGEMGEFVFNEKNKPEAAKGSHDDLVMSLAIAVACREKALQRGGWSGPPPTANEISVSEAVGW